MEEKNKGFPPFWVEQKIIHHDGHTQVQFWLTENEADGFKRLDVTDENIPAIIHVALFEYFETHE